MVVVVVRQLPGELSFDELCFFPSLNSVSVVMVVFVTQAHVHACAWDACQSRNALLHACAVHA